MTPEEKAWERFPGTGMQGTSATIRDTRGNVILPGQPAPDYNAPKREGYIAGFIEAMSILLEKAKDGFVTVSGYVARDADENLLNWFSDKPVPSKEMPGCWLVPHPLTNWVKLPKEAYPDLRPEHGPIEVDLILQRKWHPEI